MKGVGCLHLMCDISLDSDSSEMADIWLSNNEAFEDCSGADNKLQKLWHLPYKQDNVHFIFDFG